MVLWNQHYVKKDSAGTSRLSRRMDPERLFLKIVGSIDALRENTLSKCRVNKLLSISRECNVEDRA